YAAESIFQLCEDNGWKYIIRLKDNLIKPSTNDVLFISKFFFAINFISSRGLVKVNELIHKILKITIKKIKIEQMHTNVRKKTTN
ncbi:MAG: hypothetical protein ACOCRK_05870, partial [bacterium]